MIIVDDRHLVSVSAYVHGITIDMVGMVVG